MYATLPDFTWFGTGSTNHSLIRSRARPAYSPCLQQLSPGLVSCDGILFDEDTTTNTRSEVGACTLHNLTYLRLFPILYLLQSVQIYFCSSVFVLLRPQERSTVCNDKVLVQGISIGQSLSHHIPCVKRQSPPTAV